MNQILCVCKLSSVASMCVCLCKRIWNCLLVSVCSVNKTSGPQQRRIRKDAKHVLHTGPYTYIHTDKCTHTQACTHWAAKGDIHVCVALLKSLVSVKLNLGIIISSKTAESHLSSPLPFPHFQRDTEEGSGRIDSQDCTRWTRRRNRVTVWWGWGEGLMKQGGDWDGEKDWWHKKRERDSGNKKKWQDISCTDILAVTMWGK